MTKKIFVCCPGDIVTGGPELLHQLVDLLREIGKEAFISYYPFDKSFDTPTPYKHYQTPQKEINDTNDSLVIIPETATSIAKKITRAEIGIWWLSVDNYFQKDGENYLKDIIRHYRGVLHGKLLVRNMKTFHHFTQSEYAKIFLEQHSIKSEMLTDYLGRDHFIATPTPCQEQRDNLIIYNPKKGKKFTQKIIKNNPDFNFIPIQNMTASQVKGLLKRAKIYIDFGNHPGKDRLPREAAIAGCCIITGRRGAAKNKRDIPIDERFKLDEKSTSFNSDLRKLVESVFISFEIETVKFDDYRSQIQQEAADFKKQAILLFSAI